MQSTLNDIDHVRKLSQYAHCESEENVVYLPIEGFLDDWTAKMDIEEP